MAKVNGVKIETVTTASQRRKFKKLCASKGTNMSAQLAKVIAAYTKGMK